MPPSPSFFRHRVHGSESSHQAQGRALGWTNLPTGQGSQVDAGMMLTNSKEVLLTLRGIGGSKSEQDLLRPNQSSAMSPLSFQQAPWGRGR